MILIMLLLFMEFVVVVGGVGLIDLFIGMYFIRNVKWFNDHSVLQFFTALLIGIFCDFLLFFWAQNH